MNDQPSGNIMPILFVDSVDEMREFYMEKLGFGHMMGMLGKDGKFDICSMTLGNARIMLSRPQEKIPGSAPDSSRPVTIYLEVDNVNNYHEMVENNGVPVKEPLTDQWWGDRTFMVTDPYGYSLMFYQSVGELKPPPGAKIV